MDHRGERHCRGSNYAGDDDTRLEFDYKGTNYYPMRNWTNLLTRTYPYPAFDENAGNMGILSSNSAAEVLRKTFSLSQDVDNNTSYFIFSYNYNQEKPQRMRLAFNIRYTKSGVSRWLNDDREWIDEPATVRTI